MQATSLHAKFPLRVPRHRPHQALQSHLLLPSAHTLSVRTQYRYRFRGAGQDLLWQIHTVQTDRNVVCWPLHATNSPFELHAEPAPSATNVGAIIGAVCGATMAAVAVAGLAAWWCRRQRATRLAHMEWKISTGGTGDTKCPVLSCLGA